MKNKIKTLFYAAGAFMILGGIGNCEVKETSFLQMLITCGAGLAAIVIAEKLED